MQKINENATKIFCKILEKLNHEQHIKLHAESFMPLTIERLEQNIITPFGVGATYSLCHYYEQNGDLMRDPEMVFIVVDNRANTTDLEAIGIFPQMYQQDNLGLYEESICIENSRTSSFIKKWQEAHCRFANLWLRNIKQQGFLK